MNITINITTCNRYYTTLPLALMSILNQTYKPTEVILVDDNQNKEFYKILILQEILMLFKLQEIKFTYLYGESKGQTIAQQLAFENTSTDYIFKMDDDNILKSNVLELLVNTFNDKVGMVSGLILSENDIKRSIEYKSEIYNKLDDIFTYYNIQMCGSQNDNIKEVEHVYSNYLFKKDLTSGYTIDFAPAGHREDTVFSYEFYRKGYKLLINPNVIIYHLHSNGGNRSYDSFINNKNEMKFIEKLKEWNIIPDKLQLYENDNMIFTKKYGKDWLIYKK